MDKQTSNRRLRLFGPKKVGPNTSDRFGGGMPIPSMVSQMLDFIQDHGPTPAADLYRLVEERHHKRERVKYVYHKGHKLEGDAYALFLDDVVAELELAGYLTRDGDRLALGPNLKLGVPLTGLPVGMGAVVYSKEIRDTLDDAARQRLEIRSLLADLRPEGRGIRPINKQHIAELAKSMEAFGGYDTRHPITKDDEGHILSGRHRYEAAKQAGVEPLYEIFHGDDLDKLAVAIKDNIASGFTKADFDRIAKRLAAVGIDIVALAERVGLEGKRKLKRAAIIKAVLADPERSNASIARDLGVDDKTIATVKREILPTSEIDEIPSLAKSVGADGRVRHYPRKPSPPRSTPEPTPEPEPEPTPEPEPPAAQQPAAEPPIAAEPAVIDPYRETVEQIRKLGATLPRERRLEIAREWEQQT